MDGALPELMQEAGALRDEGFGTAITYSPKVFIPLTHLCRDVCSYCTFAKTPVAGQRNYLSPEQVLEIARAGQQAGCREALFTLGDKPELRYNAARAELAQMGYATTIDYLAAMCRLVIEETGLLPHVNPGVMSAQEIALLRTVSLSQGMMLESTAERLCEKGGPHHGSPDKHPTVRLQTIEDAGALHVPFTTGILIGIGETRDERVDALFAIRDLHARYGHIQEVIVQNFRAKADTRMASADEPGRDDLLWTIAAARLILGKDMSIQAPPNLSGDGFGQLIDAGINDWGGVSPVTPDHVNPEAPWPHVARLARETAAHGKGLVERLTIYPQYVAAADRWVAPSLRRAMLEQADASGLMRDDQWRTGQTMPAPRLLTLPRAPDPAIREAIDAALAHDMLDEPSLIRLFNARGTDFHEVTEAADAFRQTLAGDVVRYVVNRNINYTNVCTHGCGFCAFSKGRRSEELRGPAYNLDLAEVEARVAEAWERGASEVCMQGGIHPRYDGHTYLSLVQAAKRAQPAIHVHAFSPLEIHHGATTLGMDHGAYLAMLKDAGLGSLPGTAAEILDDEVRALICADKLDTGLWLEIVEAAHGVGLPTTSTIMFGHVEAPQHWARHLIRLRQLQQRTGGITEFVPLPFVAMEAPLYRKGKARPGPTFREAILMHAVARLAFGRLIPNIQVSWVKMGEEGVKAVLKAGANDLGGTLMDESISRAAGAAHGQEWTPARMQDVIADTGRIAQQRTTLYGVPPARAQDTTSDQLKIGVEA